MPGPTPPPPDLLIWKYPPGLQYLQFSFTTYEVLCHAKSLPIAFVGYIIEYLFHENLHSITFGT